MTVAIRFDPAFELGQLAVRQKFNPAAQIESCLRLVWGQFERQRRHGLTLHRLVRKRQPRGWRLERPVTRQFIEPFEASARLLVIATVQTGKIEGFKCDP